MTDKIYSRLLLLKIPRYHYAHTRQSTHCEGRFFGYHVGNQIHFSSKCKRGFTQSNSLPTLPFPKRSFCIHFLKRERRWPCEKKPIAYFYLFHNVSGTSHAFSELFQCRKTMLHFLIVFDESFQCGHIIPT